MALAVRRLLAFLLVLGFVGLALSPDERARAAVEDWLAGNYRANPMEAVGKPPEEALKLLERALRFPPPPPGIEVNLNEPRVESRGPEVWVRFPAAIGKETGEVVVRLRGDEVVGVAWQPEGGMLPPWVSSPWFVPLFLGGTFGLILSLFFGGLRSLWRRALRVLWMRKRLFIGTQLGLYGVFFLGVVSAYSAPDLARLFQQLVGETIAQIGLERAMVHGPLGLAAVIFYWNLTRGLLLTTALPAMLFGVPALLLNALRYYLLGFALSPAVVPLDRFLLHLPVIVLELGAYNTGVFGGLALLGEVLAGRGYRQGLRVLALSLIPATVLLFFAALYEAFEVMP